MNSGKDGMEWQPVSSEQRLLYEQLFYSQGPMEGYLTGDGVQDLFLLSKLPLHVLSQIWNLADITHDNLLDVEEFILMLHLIKGCLQGKKLPDQLPDQLIPNPRPSVVLPPTTEKENAAYTKLFLPQDPTAAEFMDERAAVKILMSSELSRKQLAHIWNCSDVDRDGRLNLDEWKVACQLVRVLKKGLNLGGSIDLFTHLPHKISPFSLQARKNKIDQYEKRKSKLMMLKEKRKQQYSRESERTELAKEMLNLQHKLFSSLTQSGCKTVDEEEFQTRMSEDRAEVDRMEAVAVRLKREHEHIRKQTVKMILGEQMLHDDQKWVKEEMDKLHMCQKAVHSFATKDPDPFHQLYEKRKEEKMKSPVKHSLDLQVYLPFQVNPFDEGFETLVKNPFVSCDNAEKPESNHSTNPGIDYFSDQFVESCVPDLAAEDQLNIYLRDEDPIFEAVPAAGAKEWWICDVKIIKNTSNKVLKTLFDNLMKIQEKMKNLKEAAPQLVFINPEDYLERKKAREEEEKKLEQARQHRLHDQRTWSEDVESVTTVGKDLLLRSKSCDSKCTDSQKIAAREYRLKRRFLNLKKTADDSSSSRQSSNSDELESRKISEFFGIQAESCQRESASQGSSGQGNSHTGTKPGFLGLASSGVANEILCKYKVESDAESTTVGCEETSSCPDRIVESSLLGTEDSCSQSREVTEKERFYERDLQNITYLNKVKKDNIKVHSEKQERPLVDSNSSDYILESSSTITDKMSGEQSSGYNSDVDLSMQFLSDSVPPPLPESKPPPLLPKSAPPLQSFKPDVGGGLNTNHPETVLKSVSCGGDSECDATIGPSMEGAGESERQEDFCDSPADLRNESSHGESEGDSTSQARYFDVCIGDMDRMVPERGVLALKKLDTNAGENGDRSLPSVAKPCSTEPIVQRDTAEELDITREKLQKMKLERKAVIDQMTVKRRDMVDWNKQESMQSGLDIENNELNGRENLIVQETNTGVRSRKINLYSENPAQESTTTDTVDRESIADLSSIRNQWEQRFASTSLTNESPHRAPAVRHWEVKLTGPWVAVQDCEDTASDTMSANGEIIYESAIEQEIRLALEREEMLKKEKEEREELQIRQRGKLPSIVYESNVQQELDFQPTYHEMTEADRGSEMWKRETIIQQEILEQQKREENNYPQRIMEEAEEDVLENTQESLIEREIRLQHEREEELKRQRQNLSKELTDTETISKNAEVQNMDLTPEEHQVISYEQAISDFQHEGENRIALELQEMKLREEEFRQRCKQYESQKEESKEKNVTQSNSIKAEVPSMQSNQTTKHYTWKKEPVVSKMQSQLVQVVSMPASMAPDQQLVDRSDEETEKVLMNETPIEREIRLAHEREEEFRRQKGIPVKKENEEKGVKLEIQTNHTAKGSPKGEPWNKTTMRKFAKIRLRQEINQEQQRELALRNEGKINTTSEERVGENLKYVEVTGQDVVDGPVKRNFKTTKRNTIMDAELKAPETGVSNSLSETTCPWRPKANFSTVFSYRETTQKAESKIERELREMREREEELRNQRKSLVIDQSESSELMGRWQKK